MKHSLSILLLLNFISISAQVDCTSDSIKYIMAYNYVVNDSESDKKIVVSDSIIDLDRFWFSEFLTDYPKEKAKLDQYRSTKNHIWATPFYSPCIASLFCQKKVSNTVLFFSIIEDNILRADLLPQKKKTNRFQYDKMAFQNTGRIYLFIFDEENNLKVVFSNDMIYD